MKLTLLLLLCFTLSCVESSGPTPRGARLLKHRPARSAESDDDANPISISADHMDYDSNTVIIRQGKKLMVSCVFERDDIGDKSDLQWRKEGSRIIDGESSPSVFTVEVLTHQTHHKKTSLHFTNIHQRDDGEYECRARTLGGEELRKTVNIKVLEEIQWKDPHPAAGALVGEPLTIDCGIRAAKGDSQIEMTDGSGEPLDEKVFTVAGTEATISNLTKDMTGTVVSCVHIEMISSGEVEDYPVIDRKDVTIDVWFKPEFESEETVTYTVIDALVRDVVLTCNVSASNPPAKHFVFYKGDNQELNDPNKYILTRDVLFSNSSTLTINNVNEDDLQTYRCEVSNGKAKASHEIHLREASPPPEPRVTFLQANRHSITFKIENVDDGPLPIQKVEIRYMRAENFNGDNQRDDEKLTEEVFHQNGARTIRAWNSSGYYEVNGLRQQAEYLFRFRQYSEAGFGDAMVLRARTWDQEAMEQMKGASTAFSLLVLLVALLW